MFSILPTPGIEVTEYPPAEVLAEHVERYWTLEISSPPAVIHLLPDGCIDVAFDLDRREAFVSGPLESSAQYTHERAVRLLGVNLRPGNAVALLGVSASTLLPEWQPLVSVIGDAARHLTALVCDASSLRERLALFDAFLLARQVAHSPDARLRHALEAIVAQEGTVDIDALGSSSGASPRNLGRLFDDWVGLAPKRFARIVRLQAVMRRIQAEPGIALGRAALEAGYADQAHLTREMRALAGISPRHLSDSFKK